jgi:hypothetical protein
MAYSLQQFYADCRSTLKADSGVGGQEGVRACLERLLKDPGDVLAALGASPKPGRHALYRDPETDMHVFAHVYGKEGGTKAHDHGSCWIIYGNISGHTDMVEWRRTDDGQIKGNAQLEKLGEYRVGAGEAVLFREGAIHETKHPAGASILIRVISGDMDQVWRHSFDPATGAIKDRPPRQAAASVAAPVAAGA